MQPPQHRIGDGQLDRAIRLCAQRKIALGATTRQLDRKPPRLDSQTVRRLKMAQMVPMLVDPVDLRPRVQTQDMVEFAVEFFQQRIAGRRHRGNLHACIMLSIYQ